MEGSAVADGDDGVDRKHLDGWQKFVHDIAGRRDRVRDVRPVRCFLIGTAGTGKSHTVQSFVRTKRELVKRKLESEVDPRLLQSDLRIQERIKSAVRDAVPLGAPTVCASFQLRFGASTLHRLFGVSIGYCGPSANRTSEKYKKKKRKYAARKAVCS